MARAKHGHYIRKSSWAGVYANMSKLIICAHLEQYLNFLCGVPLSCESYLGDGIAVTMIKTILAVRASKLTPFISDSIIRTEFELNGECFLVGVSEVA